MVLFIAAWDGLWNQLRCLKMRLAYTFKGTGAHQLTISVWNGGARGHILSGHQSWTRM